MCYRKVISGWLLVQWRLEGHLQEQRGLVWVRTWGAFPIHQEPRGVWGESKTHVSALPMQIQTNSDCSGASLDSQQSKMSFILCLTPAALCVEPGCSLLCLDCDAAGQHSHFFPLQAAPSWLCCWLPALPQPAQHQPSGWLWGSPVLPGTSWHMEAPFCSSLSSQHRPGHGFYCGQGNWESILAKADEGCKCVCN